MNTKKKEYKLTKYKIRRIQSKKHKIGTYEANKISLSCIADENRCIWVKLNGIKVRVFSGKIIETNRLCRHDKNYYYFSKSNIPVVNLIVGSRNMIKISKNMSLKKLD